MWPSMGVVGLPAALLGGRMHFWMAGLCHLGSIGTPCVSKSALICKKRCAIPSKIQLRFVPSLAREGTN